MYIVNVVQDFQTGGIQKLLLEYLRYFKNDPDIRYQIVVLESNNNSSFDKIAKEENLDIVYLGAKTSKNSHYYIRKYSDIYNYNGKLYRFIKKNKPDIVHTHNTRIFARIQYCVKRIAKKYTVVHTLHSDPSAVADVHIPIAKNMFALGVHAICLNDTQFEKAKQRYGLDKCDILYNIIDGKRFHECKCSKEEARNVLNIPQDVYVIGAVGRIEEVKDYVFLVEAFAKCVKIKNNSMLVFCGGGTEEDSVISEAKELGIADKIRILGIRRDVDVVYKALDVFASTSITESSSLVALEAQISGCTCVVAESTPPESIITDRVVRLSKDISLDIWGEELADPTHFEKAYATEYDYSPQAGAERMIKLYEEKLREKRNNA